MARDSRYGEKIVWTGRPERLETPSFLRAAALVMFAAAFISVCFAFVLTRSLGTSPASTLLFGAWAATLGLGLLHGPRVWLARVSYEVTEHHVVFKRGPFRRSIERSAVSFARIHWLAPGVGDVELVRAVPTGALRRRLMLRLYGLKAPDRVAAIIAGHEDVVLPGRDDKLLAQRLQLGERVLWAANPRPTWRSYLPRHRAWTSVALSVILLAVAVRMVATSVPTLKKLLAAGISNQALAFEALVTGLGLATLTVLASSVVLFHRAVIRPGRLAGSTRYLVTNRRVLIQRGKEELHLDRSRIVDLIDAPAGDGLRDVFLVLDGPRARALAASGAFRDDEAMPGLRPVLERVEDVEGLSRALSAPDESLPHAA
ncbi:MAG: hypothetical protein IT375_21155 [Polyangiaceae bacterium]|nr:hypothetical protein [Polyangiaceae bacterium]MCK6534752.1 hypothetical protein [Polyangiaceae bacterium]